MNSFDFTLLGRNVNLELTDGSKIIAFICNVTKAEDSADEDTISVIIENGKYDFYFPDEIRSLEIIEP